MNGKLTWTNAEDELLHDLIVKKQAFDLANRKPLEEFCKRLMRDVPAVFGDVNIMDAEVDMREYFERNADTLRDLLAPFDSGVRPAVEVQHHPV